MARGRQWVILDAQVERSTDVLELEARELGLRRGTGASVRVRRLTDGLSAGVDVVEVRNGDLEFTVVPTRGMGIWKGRYRGLDLGWSSPVRGPVHPAWVRMGERGGLGWLAGFDEMIVRCGLESNGASGKDRVRNNQGDWVETDLTLHGRIANLPAHRVEVTCIPGDSPVLEICGVVDEAMLFCPQFRLTSRIRTKIGSSGLEIVDEVRNLKSVPAEMQLLYHCNFGAPFLDEGAQLLLPASLTAPRSAYAAAEVKGWSAYAGPTPGYIEQAFWHVPVGDKRGASVALLRNAAGNAGVAVRYNVNEMPCFTQWKNTGAVSDGYVTGLEPAVNYPNPKPFERSQGRVPVLGPNEARSFTLGVDVCDGRGAVKGVEAEIGRLQGRTPHRLSLRPVKGLSA